METVCPASLRAATLIWQPIPGAFALTIVCKSTFRLLPGTAPFIEQAEPLYGDDARATADDVAHPYHLASDLVPQKPRADVLLVGHAFAPASNSALPFVVCLSVGKMNKSVEVTGERRSDGAVPCLGFAPIAPTTPPRAALAGLSGAPFPPAGAAFVDHPIPKDLDRRYFNAAPIDQQLDELRLDEQFVLENLHPQHVQFVTALPGFLPRVVFDRGRGAEPVAMRADTLWIDTDRLICTLTFRGQVRLAHRSDVGQVIISVDEATKKNSTTGSFSNDGDPAGVKEVARSPHLYTLPFSVPREEILELSEDDIDEESDRDPNVHVSSSSSSSGAVQNIGTETMMLGPDVLSRATMPFAPPVQTPAPPIAPIPIAAPLPFAPPVAPAYVPPPVAKPIPQPGPSSPWSSGPSGSSSTPITPPTALPDMHASPTPFSAPPAAKAGVLAASNAAANAEPVQKETPVEVPAVKPKTVAEAKGLGAKEALKLLYFDAAQVEAIRKHTDWRVILAALSLRLLEQGERDDDSTDEAAKTRRDVSEVLLRGDAIGAEGIRAAYASGVTEDRRFEPPLVLVMGDLELPFDELSVLKATVAAIRPMSASDKRLVEVLDAVEDLSKTPWLEGSSGIAVGLLDRVREAFGLTKRAVTWEYVEAHTERMLLERRCYQTRTLWGKKWIRGVLRGGASGDVPTYVPESLKDELPMFRRFRVKMITEVEVKEDQYETSAYALKVVVVGRIVSLT